MELANRRLPRIINPQGFSNQLEPFLIFKLIQGFATGMNLLPFSYDFVVTANQLCRQRVEFRLFKALKHRPATIEVAEVEEDNDKVVKCSKGVLLNWKGTVAVSLVATFH